MSPAKLAVDGGSPVRTEPLPPWPSYQQDEVDAAVRVLRSGRVNYWTGDETRAFERELADHIGTSHAVAVTNGTVALEAILRAAGIGEGDEVITPARTFIASASAAAQTGARPVCADVDGISQNITAETAAAVLSPRSRAIVAVHLGGWPCDMEPLRALAEAHGLCLVEDCAQAHGALYHGRAVGSLGDAAAFSFCQDKIITTAGEGGMVTTNDPALWRKIWEHKDHGKSWDAVYHRDHPPGFRWLHESFGTNWRMTEIQGAIGRVQLRKLAEWRARRQHHAAIFNERLAAQPAVRLTPVPAGLEHAFYKYYCFVRLEALRAGWDRDRIMASVMAEGSPCFSGSCSEIYLEKAFPPALRPKQRLPVARELGETSLMFPVHPTLADQDIHDMADALEKVLAVATR